jgi:hypothetical protein
LPVQDGPRPVEVVEKLPPLFFEGFAQLQAEAPTVPNVSRVLV